LLRFSHKLAAMYFWLIPKPAYTNSRLKFAEITATSSKRETIRRSIIGRKGKRQSFMVQA